MNLYNDFDRKTEKQEWALLGLLLKRAVIRFGMEDKIPGIESQSITIQEGIDKWYE